MYSVVQQVTQLIEHVSSTCGQTLVSAFNYFTMYPWISIAGAILAYLAAMRVMCR
jgi:hypothetical protein